MKLGITFQLISTNRLQIFFSLNKEPLRKIFNKIIIIINLFINVIFSVSSDKLHRNLFSLYLLKFVELTLQLTNFCFFIQKLIIAALLY
jgi:hypothetical protein